MKTNFKNKIFELSLVVYTFNPSICEFKAGLVHSGQPELHRETLSKKQKQIIKFWAGDMSLPHEPGH